MRGAGRIKSLLLGLAVLVAAIVLAACGGGGSSSGGESSSSGGGSTAASTGNAKDAAAFPEVEDWPVFGRDRDNTRFATQDDRFAHQDVLDKNLEEWTRRRDRHEMTELLQSHGVPAGAVQNAEDLNERDPQLAARGVFFEMDHPVIGMARFEGNPMQFSETRPDNWRSAPLLGEDNAYVFQDILGIEEGEYAELTSEGVI